MVSIVVTDIFFFALCRLVAVFLLLLLSYVRNHRLSDLTVDIVAEALFSGRPMAQQTPSAGPLSDYINRVSNNDGSEDQQQQ